MKNKYKKILMFLFVLVAIVSVIFLYQTTKKTIVSPKALPLPTPVITFGIKGGFEIGLDFPEERFTFPTTGTIDRKTIVSLKEEVVRGVSIKLGFEGNPITAEDIADGTVLIYSTSVESLVVYKDKGIYNYTLNTLPQAINKQLSDSEIRKTAEDFLTDNGFIGQLNLVFDSLLFLGEKGTEGAISVSKSEASFYQVNFYPKASDRRFVTLNPERSSIYVQVLPDGEIFSASVKPFLVATGPTEYKLKKYEEFVSSLPSSILVSLEEGNVHLPDIKREDVESVSITEVNLAYVVDESDLLQPIYLLEGSASVVGERMKAIFYLPAISNQP